MARKHKLDEVLNSLKKKRDIKINPKSRKIQVLSSSVWDEGQARVIKNPRRRNDLGNGSWGKIDFLVNYCGYTIYSVGEFWRY